MPIKIIDYNSTEYKQVIELRYMLLRQPLGLTFNQEDLDKEKDDIHIAAYEEDELLGCCFLSKVNVDTVKLRQMAVKGNLQGKGIGRQMMQFAENIARDYGNKCITMHARKDAVGFYEKLGYTANGAEFIEVQLPHYEMSKPLL